MSIFIIETLLKTNNAIYTFPKLITNRTTLRALNESDAEAFYSYYNVEELFRDIDWYRSTSIIHAKETILPKGQWKNNNGKF